MSTALLVGAAALGATLLLQLIFPGFMTSIMSGLSYGSVKALLETWSANREKRKKARQEAHKQLKGVGRRRRRHQNEPAPRPVSTPVRQSAQKVMSGDGTSERVESEPNAEYPKYRLLPLKKARWNARQSRRGKGGD